MSKLLLDEQPLIVLPKLATKIGLNESIIVQQIHYWLTQKQNARDGYYWVYNTYPKWVEQFPFWSESTVKRSITNLQDLNILIVGNYNKLKIDKTKWYRINYEELRKYEDTEVFDGRVKMTSSTGQIDLFDGSERTDGKVNLNRPLPESTTETPTKTPTDIKDNVQSEIERQFEEFWSLYPKKTTKKQAKVKFIVAVKEHGYKTIIDGVNKYIAEINFKKTAAMYIKNPATFLYNECYLEEFVTGVNKNGQPVRKSAEATELENYLGF